MNSEDGRAKMEATLRELGLASEPEVIAENFVVGYWP
jgi:hypothetical protein